MSVVDDVSKWCVSIDDASKCVSGRCFNAVPAEDDVQNVVPFVDNVQNLFFQLKIMFQNALTVVDGVSKCCASCRCFKMLCQLR